ncbi:hypothetical protein SDC9_155443 [bioreactor metagenome]|uniref:DUF2806 domain-containing protein n=1 Tax=bioreactor metagenome TaxID=1076179 RepID=A0A645F6Q9_9ZZZZ
MQKAAFISNARKIVKEYTNQDKIVEIALEQFGGKEHPENIDDDWLSHFMDGARHVSDDEMRLVWGRVLAGECENPGSMPKQLIHTLSFIPIEVAKSFVKLCNCAVFFHNNGDETPAKYPIIAWQNNKRFFTKNGISFYLLSEMDSYGLIKFDSGNGYCLQDVASTKIVYFDSILHINEIPENTLNIGNVMLTKVGKSLLDITTQEKCEGYFETCKAFWQQEECEITDEADALEGAGV